MMRGQKRDEDQLARLERGVVGSEFASNDEMASEAVGSGARIEAFVVCMKMSRISLSVLRGLCHEC